jgi:hypothetical protein
MKARLWNSLVASPSIPNIADQSRQQIAWSLKSMKPEEPEA